MIRLIFVCLFFITSANAQWDIGELIIEYEQECYSDSSYLLVAQKQHPTNLVYTLPKWEWVHREPDWAGFREFIKRKYQKMVGVVE